MLNPLNRDNISILAISEKVREYMASSPEMTDAEVEKLCRKVVLNDPVCIGRSLEECSGIIRKVFCTLRCELEILQDMADDPAVTEIMVNGPSDIFIEKNGKIMRAEEQFETRKQLERVIQRIAARVGREINDLNPIVDARLSDGSRINAVASNIAIGGPILTIRKFNRSRMTMEDLIAQGDISCEAADFLKELVECGYNIFISGGTSSGKTTFLNVLSDFIPAAQRVVVIEDSAELQIRGHENLVRLEAKSANAQGKGSVSIRELIRSSLRMRPDRIIVGEVRGEEVIDMISAMSTGHDGSLSTGHANSAKGMIKRLEMMFLSGTDFPLEAIRGQIAGGIDLFVHLARTADGHRRVMEISELIENGGMEIGLNTIYQYAAGQGLVKTGNEIVNRDKLALAGK